MKLTGRRNPQPTPTVARPGNVGAHLRPAIDISWHEDAACRDHDPELFFPPEGRGPQPNIRPALVQKAVNICHSCPVRRPCILQGLDEPRLAAVTAQ